MFKGPRGWSECELSLTTNNRGSNIRVGEATRGYFHCNEERIHEERIYGIAHRNRVRIGGGLLGW